MSEKKEKGSVLRVFDIYVREEGERISVKSV